MFHFFLECTIRAALIVGATALVLYAMRVKVASVKHRVWTAVLLLMLALPLWIAWGPKAPIRILPANVENFTADFLDQTPPPSKAPLQKTDTSQATPAPVQSLLSPLEWSFLGLYLFGALIFLARLAIGTSKARRLVRESSSLELFFAEKTPISSQPTSTANKEKSRHPEGREATRRTPLAFFSGAAERAIASGKSMPGTNKEKFCHPERRPSRFQISQCRHPEPRPYLRALRRTSLAFLSCAAERAIAPGNRPHRIRISAACAAPVTVGCLRPTILLPENWREWPAFQLAAVLAHEREHARRRDPLIQWLALFNRAIFWFHPAAWWLERELSALAEESCDVAVLAQGHDPAAYAETLMHMARTVMHSGSRVNAIGTAMPGPRLPQRIRCIIEERVVVRFSRARTASLVVACAIISAAFLAVTLTPAQSSDTLAWENAAGGTMSFEVASVKQNKSGLPPSGEIPRSNFPLDETDKYPSTGGLFSVTNYPLIAYIAFAYKLPTTRELANAPGWLSTQFFDVQAHGPATATKDQMRLMVQSLLRDRFKLAVHWQVQPGAVLILSPVKPGKLGWELRPHVAQPPCAPEPTAHTPMSLQLRTVDNGLPAVCGRLIGTGGGSGVNLGARNMTMAALARYISTDMMTSFNRQVIDETGLAGGYDLKLTYTVEPSTERPQPGDFQAAFIAALRDQLGLKLQPATGSLERLVIDHIEEPTPN